MTSEHIPHLRIEREAGMVTVSQSKAGVVSSVALHPTHVRHLAEVCGLAPASDLSAAKQLATLARRLRVLHRRIDELGNWLTNHADHEHADLSHELVLVTALAELADEFVADLPDAQAQAP